MSQKHRDRNLAKAIYLPKNGHSLENWRKQFGTDLKPYYLFCEQPSLV